MNKPRIVRYKGQWLCYQWFGQKHIWGWGDTVQDAWDAFAHNMWAFS